MKSRIVIQRLWADAILPPHHQQRFSINTPAGICVDDLFGLHVLPNRLAALITKLSSKKRADFLGDVPLIIRIELHFMHDDAPARFSLAARRYLDRKFPDLWVRRTGLIAWLPGSPDLNQYDFYLWGRKWTHETFTER
jgi:hypothetical protein